MYENIHSIVYVFCKNRKQKTPDMNSLQRLIILIMQHIGFLVSYVIYRVFLKVEIVGADYLEKEEGPFIIASNHVHEIDPMLLVLIFKFSSKHFPVVFVTNPKEKYNTFGWRSYVYGGAFFEMLGGYSVFSGQKDYAYALSRHTDFLEEGHSVIIFPEGRRTKDGNIGPARGGLGYLAYATGVPVVPVAISGLFGITCTDFLFRRRKVVIKVGELMRFNFTTDEGTKELYTQTSEIVLKQIESMIKQ